MTAVELRALEVSAEVMLDGGRQSWEPRPKWLHAFVIRKTPKQLIVSTRPDKTETHRIDVDRARVIGGGFNSGVFPATPERKAENMLNTKRQRAYYALSDFARIKTHHAPEDVCDAILSLHEKLAAQDLFMK